MKKRINKKTIIGICTVFILFIIVIFLSSISNISEDNIETNASMSSNKKIGWGIKRESDHKQPDLGSSNKKVLEDNNGIAMGNSEKKYIYLTFDEGYEAGYTEKILEVLKSNQVSATFFITAHYVNTQEELVKKMIDEGHIVGNHTVNHKSMPDLSEEEIKKEVMDLHQVISEKYNYEMKYIRPPKGEFSERTIQETNKLGYKTEWIPVEKDRIAFNKFIDDKIKENFGFDTYAKAVRLTLAQDSLKREAYKIDCRRMLNNNVQTKMLESKEMDLIVKALNKQFVSEYIQL